MKKYFGTGAFMAYLLIGSLIEYGCDKGGGDGGGDYIPDVGAFWTTEKGTGGPFVLTDTHPGTNKGTFTGVENNNFNLNGTYTNANVQFTFDNNAGYPANRKNITFTGIIDHATTTLRMRLKSSQGDSLVIKKN